MAPQHLCFAKIDSRLKDARRPLLTAIHRAITIHGAVLVRIVIVAVDAAMRANAALEIGGIAADVGRVNVAGLICP